MDHDGSTRTWRIGELAAAARVSVRMLRHYDAIGLLRPAARTEAGYRVYAEADLRRLYRILGLRSLGVPLPEIGGLLDACAGDGDPSIDDLTDTMEAMAMTDRYYTREQQETLAARRDQLDPEGMRAAEQAWADLIAAAEAERAAGTDPADPRMQSIATRWRELIDQFAGGDPDLRASQARAGARHREGRGRTRSAACRLRAPRPLHSGRS